MIFLLKKRRKEYALEKLVSREHFYSGDAELVWPNLGVVRYSAHRLSLNRPDNIAFVKESVEKDDSLRQEFLQLKSSIHQRGLQLAGDKRRATRICKSVEEGDSGPPLFQFLHITEHQRSYGVQSDPSDVLSLYNFVDGLQTFCKVRDVTWGPAIR